MQDIRNIAAGPLPPATPRRARKRERTAAHLAAAAMRLFETDGYEAVTMERIAAEADVAKGTLYNYFPVKEALLAYRLHQEIADGMVAIAGALARERGFEARLRRLLRASAQWNSARRAYLPHYLRFRSQLALRPGQVSEQHGSGTRAILEALFNEAQVAGELRTDVAASVLAQTFESMLYGAVLLWLQQPQTLLAQHFDFAADVLLRGVALRARSRPRQRQQRRPWR